MTCRIITPSSQIFLAVISLLLTIGVSEGFCSKGILRGYNNCDKDETSSAFISSRLSASTDEIPTDNHFSKNPLTRIGAFFNANKEAMHQHDRFLEQTGGLWRTRALGILDSVAVSAVAPHLVQQVATAEAKGDVMRTWPAAVNELLGPRSLATVENPNDLMFVASRKIFVDALSLKSILQSSSSSSLDNDDAARTMSTTFRSIETEIAGLTESWKKAAASNETVIFQEDVSRATYRVILKTVG